MIIIGERINASRKPIREAIISRDSDRIRQEIQAQDQAGAAYIDLNAGTGVGDVEKELDDMKWLIEVALTSTEKNLAIDSADPLILKGAAEFIAGRRTWLLNSVKGDPNTMSSLLSLAAEYSVPVIALAMDSQGIPPESRQRIKVIENILDAATSVGIEQKDIFFDPLVLPISSDIQQGKVTLETLRQIKDLFPYVKTTLGLSNISHGLPQRPKINQAFVIAAIAHGLDSAICDPMDNDFRRAILLGELIAGKDRHCRRFTRAIRKDEF